jgi:hypothetical protein
MQTAAYYRAKAARFREMANDTDDHTAASLIQLAEDYEAEARDLEPDAEPPNPAQE